MNILLLSPLDSFFDRDVQSLLGIRILLYYLSPLNDDIGKAEADDYKSFAIFFATNVYTYKYDLSSSLKCHSIKSHYFLGRQFLARYLKLRCRIDCDLPYSEELTEFAVHKTNLPFEHIIRKFFLRKLRIAKQNQRVSSHQLKVSVYAI